MNINNFTNKNAYLWINPTEQTSNTLDIDDNTAKLAESVITTLSSCIVNLTTRPQWNNLQNILHFLEAKIDASRKTATAWDAYHIIGCASTQEELNQLYCKLSNNSGLIINGNNFLFNGQICNRGDILFKTTSGDPILIKSAQTGYYKPASTTTINTSTGNTQFLTFNYQSGSAAPNSETMVEIKNPVSETVVYNSFIILSDNHTEDKILYKTAKPVIEVYEYNTTKGTIGDRLFNAVTLAKITENNEEKLKITRNSNYLNTLCVIIK